MRQIVVFLNSAIQSSDWGGQPSRREAGEIILEEVASRAREYAEEKNHT
jgi:hypothetical protein